MRWRASSWAIKKRIWTSAVYQWWRECLSVVGAEQIHCLELAHIDGPSASAPQVSCLLYLVRLDCSEHRRYRVHVT